MGVVIFLAVVPTENNTHDEVGSHEAHQMEEIPHLPAENILPPLLTLALPPLPNLNPAPAPAPTFDQQTNKPIADEEVS